MGYGTRRGKSGKVIDINRGVTLAKKVKFFLCWKERRRWTFFWYPIVPYTHLSLMLLQKSKSVYEEEVIILLHIDTRESK